MLSANARSKAKLPICAMWENPNVFFQKPTMEATATGRKRSPGRTVAGLTKTLDRQRFVRFNGTGAGRRRKRFRRRTAAGARPPGGLEKRALRALLMVALSNLALRSHPVFRFVAWFKSATLRHEVGDAADFVFQVNGNKIGAGFRLNDLRFPRGLLWFRSYFRLFALGDSSCSNVSWDPRFAPRFTVDEAAGLFGAGTTSFTLLFFLGSFGLAIMVSLHPPKFRND